MWVQKCHTWRFSREVRGYIINLDATSDRWSFIKTAFAKTQITLCRVPAIDGNTLRLPHKDYSESRYRLFHGRETNTLEIGCYLSHVIALETFLSTDEEFAIIGEDDIVINQDLEAVLAKALLLTILERSASERIISGEADQCDKACWRILSGCEFGTCEG